MTETPSGSENFRNVALGIAAVASSILIPAAGLWLADHQQRDEINKEFVKLGIDILSKPPAATGKPDPVREWALQVVDRYSEVKLSPAAQQMLSVQPIVIRTVSIPVPVPCRPKIGPPPDYPDTDAKIEAAPDLFEKTKLIVAGRLIRVAREAELEAVLKACAG